MECVQKVVGVLKKQRHQFLIIEIGKYTFSNVCCQVCTICNRVVSGDVP